MKKAIAGVLLGALAAAGITWHSLSGKVDSAWEQVKQLTEQVETHKTTLLGYTSYKDHLLAGERALAGQARLITATIDRPESQLRFVQQTYLGVPFNATVKVSYDAEYAFGYDLSPQSYSLKETSQGIEIALKSPVILVATPALKNLKGEVLQRSIAISADAILADALQQMPKRVGAQGREMTRDPTVVALCEKRLVAFLRDFLSKQPGVKVIPNIAVRYEKSPAGAASTAAGA
jgi:hypothetical protein